MAVQDDEDDYTENEDNLAKLVSLLLSTSLEYLLFSFTHRTPPLPKKSSQIRSSRLLFKSITMNNHWTILSF